MARQVRMAARAEEDVSATLTWMTVQRSPSASSRWHAALLASVQTLEDRAESCPLAEEAQTLGIELRQLLFGKRRGKYRILFTITGDTVNVLHVLHSARDWIRAEDLEE